MGTRKKQMADAIKEEKKQIAFAKLNNCPTSPEISSGFGKRRKSRKSASYFKFSQKEASNRLEKLLLSAISNWKQKMKMQM